MWIWKPSGQQAKINNKNLQFEHFLKKNISLPFYAEEYEMKQAEYIDWERMQRS